MSLQSKNSLLGFFSLTPEQVLNSVESALNLQGAQNRATGRLFALNSIENRVYQIELEDSSFVVAKFYRPERWSLPQIEEEHRFTQALSEAEIPVAAPLLLSNGSTVEKTPEGIFFAVFPRIQGRMNDEPSDDDLSQLGRFLGRLHNVGQSFPCKHRLRLTVEQFGVLPLEFLLQSSFLDSNMKIRYEAVAQEIFRQASPLLKDIPLQAIHGDCHLGNVLWKTAGHSGPGNFSKVPSAPFFVDFDDMMVGPVVQDLWMVTKGRDAEDVARRDVLLASYEQMRAFDSSQLRLVEPLRALRMIHYSYWIARRWQDPSFPKTFPQFATQQYWQEELEALEQALQLF